MRNPLKDLALLMLGVGVGAYCMVLVTQWQPDWPRHYTWTMKSGDLTVMVRLHDPSK